MRSAGPAHPIFLDPTLPIAFGLEYQTWISSKRNLFKRPLTPPPPSITSPYSPSACVLPSVWQTEFHTHTKIITNSFKIKKCHVPDTPREGQEIPPLPAASRLSPGLTHPPVDWLPVLYPREIKRPEREIDPSPQSSAMGKNVWAILLPPIRAFMACTGTTHTSQGRSWPRIWWHANVWPALCKLFRIS